MSGKNDPKAYLSKQYRHLQRGSTYRIARAFQDYDQHEYRAGETIEFIGSNFVPYEDGLSLFCLYNGTETQIRLQLRPEEQQDIVDHLEQYFVVME